MLDKEISKKGPVTLKSLVMLYWLSRAQRKDHLHGFWSRWQSRDLRTSPWSWWPRGDLIKSLWSCWQRRDLRKDSFHEVSGHADKGEI